MYGSVAVNVLSISVQSLLSETQTMTYIVLCDARKLMLHVNYLAR